MKNKTILVLVVLLLSFTALRFFEIQADPPGFIDFGNGNFTDEGFKTDYSRTIFLGNEGKIFLGRYCEDCLQSNQTSVNNPIVNGLYVFSFSLFGVGFFSIRVVAIILSLLSVFVFCYTLRKDFGNRFALVVGVLLVSSFVFFAFNRLALLENFILLFIALSFFCFNKIKAWKGKIFSSVLICFALFSKFSSSSALPIMSSNIPNSLLLLVRDYAIMVFNRAFRFTAILYVVGLISGLMFLLRSKKDYSIEQLNIFWFCLIWLFGGMAVFGFFTYQPSRYFYLVFPPLAFFAAYLICFAKVSKKLRALVFVGILVSQVFLFGVYVNDLNYSQFNSSTIFSDVVKDSVVGGSWCPTLGIESIALCQRGIVGVPFSQEQIAFFELGFLVLSDSEFEEQYEEFAYFEGFDFLLLEEFNINNNKIFLFKILETG